MRGGPGRGVGGHHLHLGRGPLRCGAPDDDDRSVAAVVAVVGSGAVNPAMDAELNASIDANDEYQIGVALIDVSDGAVHDYGVQRAFVAASTAKVLAAAAYYHLVESGGASLNEPMGDWTAGFQLKEMIQDSDNDSSSLIMAALYSGKLLNPDDTAQLLSYLQGTNYESLVPEAAPADVEVFHKYGLLDGELHDAGILAKDGRAYALVIYTKSAGDGDVPQRTDVIHQLTRAVTDAVF